MRKNRNINVNSISSGNVGSISIDVNFKNKMLTMVKLKKNIATMKNQLTELKQETLDYVEKNPQIKTNKGKFEVDDCIVHFTNKNVSDAMSQKLIVSGLIQYFKTKGVNGQSVNTEIVQIIEFIKKQRTTKSVPHIDFKMAE